MRNKLDKKKHESKSYPKQTRPRKKTQKRNILNATEVEKARNQIFMKNNKFYVQAKEKVSTRNALWIK